MKQKSYLIFAVVIFTTVYTANAQSNFAYDNTNTSSTLYEDANSNIGIGTTTPSAKLQVNRYSANNEDYFAINKFTLSLSYAQIESPVFKINADGNVGIGTATPQAPLHVKCKNWNDGTHDMGEPIQFYEDPNGQILGGFFNESDGTGDPAGAFVVMTNAASLMPAFGIFNAVDQVLPFGVMGNSTVAMGIDVSSSGNFAPQAQVNITKNNTYDYLLKLQSTDQSQDYFDVKNNGEVGIGTFPTPNTALTVYDGAVNTKLDIVNMNTGKGALRFIEGTSSVPTHQITSTSGGDLLIDPGLSGGGGNDKLKIDGDEEITGSLNVGFGTSSAQPVLLF